MKRYILFAIGAPVAVWLGLIAIGGKRGDTAGTTVLTSPGFLANAPHGLLAESMAAGALVAFLTK